jgi:hypothetical protein
LGFLATFLLIIRLVGGFGLAFLQLWVEVPIPASDIFCIDKSMVISGIDKAMVPNLGTFYLKCSTGAKIQYHDCQRTLIPNKSCFYTAGKRIMV